MPHPMIWYATRARRRGRQWDRLRRKRRHGRRGERDLPGWVVAAYLLGGGELMLFGPAAAVEPETVQWTMEIVR